MLAVFLLPSGRASRKITLADPGIDKDAARMRFVYCPQCGDRLTSRALGDEGPTPYCVRCTKPFFDVPRPCVLVAVLNEVGEVALLKQSYISETHRVLVAGLIKPDETAEEAAAREVEEETGQNVQSVRYVASYGHPRADALMLGFVARVEKREFCLSCEVDEAAWFPIEDARGLLKPGSIGQKLFSAVRQLIEREAGRGRDRTSGEAGRDGASTDSTDCADS
jgi:NAD+ diphosphatase